ncbi:hypothetical protein HGRIS_012045 [Hohenbuehelia grisea]|uniref:Uncharacterized protein n=1 Tax=Hohenbuehelia grisea TaxID=104357 RepID=A0ABR3IR24_9AGAR
MAPTTRSTRPDPKIPPTDAKKRRSARKSAQKSFRDSSSEPELCVTDDQKDWDSDALDEPSEPESNVSKLAKRKRASYSHHPATTPIKVPRKRPRKSRETPEGEIAEGEGLEEGQELVGVIVQAPTSGRVPPGRISQNTLDFLAKLKDPECNDRHWFKLHEPVYRVLEKEWKDFVEEFTSELTEVDPQIPYLPPNDVIHRIYRDVRFSNDKTPYKIGVSASFSRSGRKGIFAGLKSNGESLIAAGSWCPGKNELATIRSNILRNPSRLRDTISAPEFVQLFGAAKRPSDGRRSNIFGMDDELKVAPKGIDKSHPDIDLLKCRSFAVARRFKDSEVLEPNFKTKLADIARVMRPFVYCLNDMMTIPPDNDASSQED